MRGNFAVGGRQGASLVDPPRPAAGAGEGQCDTRVEPGDGCLRDLIATAIIHVTTARILSASVGRHGPAERCE